MDKDQARFILQSYRSEGADANDPDFTEALVMAIKDRELCEWLANERAFDTSFAKALAMVELPDNLRQNIMRCIAAERGDIPQAADSIDQSLMEALTSIQAPASLRNQVLTAMEHTVRTSRPKNTIRYRLAIPLAAAAGVALAFWVTNSNSTSIITPSHKLPIEVVQTNFIHAFESPDFTLDEKREDHRELLKILKARKLPCPCCLPHGLANVKSIGCREIIIDGKHGSIICFDEGKNGIVHLVVFRREDVDGELPNTSQPQLGRCGRWATARWEHDKNVFILIATTETEKLAALF